jgi:hypothetical protein
MANFSYRHIRSPITQRHDLNETDGGHMSCRSSAKEALQFTKNHLLGMPCFLMDEALRGYCSELESG